MSVELFGRVRISTCKPLLHFESASKRVVKWESSVVLTVVKIFHLNRKYPRYYNCRTSVHY